jgi:hypothetical protein
MRRVFAAFWREACELGKQGTWCVDRIRSEVDEFLRVFIIDAHHEEGRDRSGREFRAMTYNWNGSLLPEVERYFYGSEEWHQYEAALLAVAEKQAEEGDFATPKQAGATDSSGDDSTRTGAGPAVNGTDGNHPARRGHRAEIKAYMKACSLGTNLEAARRLGVGVDTLKSIMSEKGKPRYSEATLKTVLDKITKVLHQA